MTRGLAPAIPMVLAAAAAAHEDRPLAPTLESVALLFNLRDATLMSARQYARIGDEAIRPCESDLACR
jgi:hypothetical protein